MLIQARSLGYIAQNERLKRMRSPGPKVPLKLDHSFPCLIPLQLILTVGTSARMAKKLQKQPLDQKPEATIGVLHCFLANRHVFHFNLSMLWHKKKSDVGLIKSTFPVLCRETCGLQTPMKTNKSVVSGRTRMFPQAKKLARNHRPALLLLSFFSLHRSIRISRIVRHTQALLLPALCKRAF